MTDTPAAPFLTLTTWFVSFYCLFLGTLSVAANSRSTQYVRHVITDHYWDHNLKD